MLRRFRMKTVSIIFFVVVCYSLFSEFCSAFFYRFRIQISIQFYRGSFLLRWHVCTYKIRKCVCTLFISIKREMPWGGLSFFVRPSVCLSVCNCHKKCPPDSQPPKYVYVCVLYFSKFWVLVETIEMSLRSTLVPNIRSKYSFQNVNKFNSDMNSNLDIDRSHIYILSRVL